MEKNSKLRDIAQAAYVLEEACKHPENATDTENPYWTTNIYGVSRFYRKYGFYPKNKPLFFYCSHGVSLSDVPARYELHNTAPLVFYNSPRFVEKYREVSSKPCYCVVSPFVYCRRSHKITRKNTKNTICFFAHTTAHTEDVSDLHEFIKQLNNIDEKYKPITICLHYHDINKGVHYKFLEAGFDVVTAGNPYHPDFIIKFYEILSEYQHAISNEVGSYLYYSIEMDIPFFLYGNEPIYINKTDKNMEKGLYTSYKHSQQMQKAKELFTVPTEQVTQEQKEFVEKELGVYDSISRAKFSILLYWAWWRSEGKYKIRNSYLLYPIKLGYKFFKKKRE